MEIRHLEVFVAVAEELHFGRAAERLFMAPAPLSRTIQQLERELEASLFVRTTRTVELTPAGRAFLEPARQALVAVRSAQRSVGAALRGEVGVVSIEFAGAAAHPLVATLSRRLRAKRPGIGLDLFSASVSRPSMARLLNREIDLAFGRWDHIPAGVETKRVATDALALVVPKSHRLSSASQVGFADFARESFVSLPIASGSITTDRLWRIGGEIGMAIDNVQFAPDTLSCVALVRANVGLHLTLRSAVAVMANPDVRIIGIAGEDEARLPDVDLRVIWRKSGNSPVIDAVLGLVDELPTL
jgi:DNA-binding transcriptional LysR family regulator